MTYEPPQITTVGSVPGLTRGGYDLQNLQDENRKWWKPFGDGSIS